MSTPSYTIKDSNDGIHISWSKVTGATSYSVVRKTGGYKKWDIGGNSNRSITDTSVKDGVQYTYMIYMHDSSYNYYGGHKYCGSITHHVIKPKVKLSKVSSINYKNTDTGILLSWGNVAHASAYKIERALKTSSYYTTISSYNTRSNFLDQKAKAGKVYKYRITAIGKGDYTNGSPGGIKCVRLKTPKLKGRVWEKTCKINLRWKKANVKKYILEIASNKKFTRCKVTLKISGSKKSKLFIPKKSGKYYFRIRSYVSKKHMSAWSNIVALKIKIKKPAS